MKPSLTTLPQTRNGLSPLQLSDTSPAPFLQHTLTQVTYSGHWGKGRGGSNSSCAHHAWTQLDPEQTLKVEESVLGPGPDPGIYIPSCPAPTV